MNKLILIPIVLVILFSLLLTANFVLYKTWGGNEWAYVPMYEGAEMECDINLLQKPSNCRPMTTENSFPYNESGSITIETMP